VDDVLSITIGDIFYFVYLFDSNNLLSVYYRVVNIVVCFDILFNFIWKNDFSRLSL